MKTIEQLEMENRESANVILQFMRRISDYEKFVHKLRFRIDPIRRGLLQTGADVDADELELLLIEAKELLIKHHAS